MFYVKGNSFLLSFSKQFDLENNNNSSNSSSKEKERIPLQENQNGLFTSFIAHLFTGGFDMLPVFLILASSMSLLAYIYTILLIPSVMTATIPALSNHTGNTTEYNGTEVPLDIGCPFLKPRDQPAQDVHDLRPDDIKIVMGLGDSVMAAFAAKGIQKDTFFTIENLYENRGISFAMGGVSLLLSVFLS